MTYHRRLVRYAFDVARISIVFVAAAIAVWIVVNHNVRELERAQAIDAWARYDTSYASCVRGQVTRADTNQQSQALRQLVTVLDIYLDNAAELRVRTTNPDLANEAEIARVLLRETVATLRDTPAINCDTAVIRPKMPRP